MTIRAAGLEVDAAGLVATGDDLPLHERRHLGDVAGVSTAGPIVVATPDREAHGDPRPLGMGMIVGYIVRAPLLPGRFLLDALPSHRQSELRLRAEILAVRHQLRVLQRQVRRPRWQRADRLLLPLSAGSPRRSQRSWRQFIRQQADHLLAVDYFDVDTCLTA